MIREIVSAIFSVLESPIDGKFSQTGIGNGAYIVIHDGFAGLATWKDFLPGSDVRAFHFRFEDGI